MKQWILDRKVSREEGETLSILAASAGIRSSNSHRDEEPYSRIPALFDDTTEPLGKYVLLFFTWKIPNSGDEISYEKAIEYLKEAVKKRRIT